VALYPRGKKRNWHIEFEFKGQRIKRSTGTASKKEAQ
jgi:hypothetical protein